MSHCTYIAASRTTPGCFGRLLCSLAPPACLKPTVFFAGQDIHCWLFICWKRRCGHCRKFEPLYKELAKSCSQLGQQAPEPCQFALRNLRHVKSLKIAKIDATRNEAVTLICTRESIRTRNASQIACCYTALVSTCRLRACKSLASLQSFSSLPASCQSGTPVSQLGCSIPIWILQSSGYVPWQPSARRHDCLAAKRVQHQVRREAAAGEGASLSQATEPTRLLSEEGAEAAESGLLDRRLASEDLIRFARIAGPR